MKVFSSFFLLVFAVSAGSKAPLLAQTANNIGAAQAISTAHDSLAIRALSPEPGRRCLYEITFTTSDTLSTRADLTLTFPAAFDLSALEIAGSAAIDGGLTLEKDRQRVTIRRTGRGTAIGPGQRIRLKMGLFQNPANIRTPYTIQAELRSRASQNKLSFKKTVRISFE